MASRFQILTGNIPKKSIEPKKSKIEIPELSKKNNHYILFCGSDEDKVRRVMLKIASKSAEVLYVYAKTEPITFYTNITFVKQGLSIAQKNYEICCVESDVGMPLKVLKNIAKEHQSKYMFLFLKSRVRTSSITNIWFEETDDVWDALLINPKMSSKWIYDLKGESRRNQSIYGR